MATEIKLPDQLEGVDGITVTRWLVKEGDTVQAGDALLEVATDKVDTEVPSPVAGSILKINYRDGETMPANPVLALIGAAGETLQAAEVTPVAPASPVQAPAAAAETGEKPKATPVARRIAEERGIDLEAVKGSGPRGQVTKEDVLTYEAPPAVAAESAVLRDAELADLASLPVARLAVENNIDLRALAAGRPLGAITRNDVLSAIASRAAGHSVTVRPRPIPEPAAPPAATPAAVAAPSTTTQAAPPPAARPVPTAAPQAGEDFIPHSRMRQLIARNTMQSAFGIPHVTTMWDVNMAAVLAHRKAHKAEFAAAGVNLTVTAYLVQAIVTSLRAVPVANARWTDEGVVVKRFYHIGVAVALPPDKNGIGGLIVPVIKHASDLNLMGIARAVNDLAERARTGQLKPAELQEGTFTLTNYGTSGSRFQTPIIHDGQAGILGVGAIEKRPVVVSNGSPLEANTGDHLAFLPMTTLGFSYDHRILDGATADAFCAAVKNALENWS